MAGCCERGNAHKKLGMSCLVERLPDIGANLWINELRSELCILGLQGEREIVLFLCEFATTQHSSAVPHCRCACTNSWPVFICRWVLLEDVTCQPAVSEFLSLYLRNKQFSSCLYEHCRVATDQSLKWPTRSSSPVVRFPIFTHSSACVHVPYSLFNYGLSQHSASNCLGYIMLNAL